MNNEYWLQKKTIGGWSHVTWYSTIDEAMSNFNRVSGDLNGYSWRVVKVELVEERLLTDAAPILSPETILTPARSNDWSKPVKLASDNPMATAIISEPSRHGLSGKIWMVNRQSGHKTRIDPSLMQEFEERGYIRGGPRS